MSSAVDEFSVLLGLEVLPAPQLFSSLQLPLPHLCQTWEQWAEPQQQGPLGWLPAAFMFGLCGNAVFVLLIIASSHNLRPEGLTQICLCLGSAPGEHTWLGSGLCPGSVGGRPALPGPALLGSAQLWRVEVGAVLRASFTGRVFGLPF